MRVYQCEDTQEGIFTAIYNAYEDRADPKDTCLSVTVEYFLFAEYVPVVTDWEKARKVADTLRRRFGEEDFFLLCLALSAEDTQKAQAFYRTVVHGLASGAGRGHLFDQLSDDWIHRAFALGRGANHEYLHMRGFLRFEELQGGVLYAAIGTGNRLLPFLMPHFADRLPAEDFLVHDVKRGLLGVHPAGQDWYLMRVEDDFSKGEEQAGEIYYRELFREFCEKLAVEERRNIGLQRSMLPLRFRRFMTEFGER